MEILNEKEAQNYMGGAKLTAAFGLVFGAVVSFVLGVVNGFSTTMCRR